MGDRSMTLREWLAWTYPLHFQRILEEGYDQSRARPVGSPSFDAVLAGLPGDHPLAHCFAWERTEEGHEYWWRLDGHNPSFRWTKAKAGPPAVEWSRRSAVPRAKLKPRRARS